MVSCQISLNTPEGSKIIAGKTLKGIVKYELDKEITYKTISISLVGQGHCAWFHRQIVNNRTSNETVKCQANETYNAGKIHLVKREKNDKESISIGAYEHQFEIDVPEFIPPSFKNELCEIKYHLIVKFKKFGFFSFNKQFRFKVQIGAAIPNSIPDDPVTIGLDKTLTKFFTDRTRKINVKAKLDRVYLIPSEDSKIYFLVTNDSDVTPSIKTELIHTTTFRDAQNNTKIEEKVVDQCTLKTPCVLENSVANMHNTISVLPELCTVRHSNIIMREFKLKITMKLPLPHVNASVEVPVFVGERALSEEWGLPPTYSQAMCDDKCKD